MSNRVNGKFFRKVADLPIPGNGEFSGYRPLGPVLDIAAEADAEIASNLKTIIALQDSRVEMLTKLRQVQTLWMHKQDGPAHAIIVDMLTVGEVT